MEETNEVSESNKIKIIVITALIFLVSIAGISYAYFTIQITGNDTASSMRLRTANMSLVYNDVQIVSGEYAEPGWTQTKTLTVTNNGNVDANYTIIWRDLTNEITNGELVISATCSSSSGSCSNMSEMAVPTSMSESHNITVKRGISIAPGVTHTYTLTATFKETGSNQNYNQNKYFNGTLNIAEGSEPSTVSLQTDQGTAGLSTGDIVRLSKTGMENQDFYVVSSDSNETVLLAKYSLLVGNVYNYDGSSYTLNKVLTSSDTGYGLQSSTAKGFVDGGGQHIGVVPFSGTNYWDDSVCQYTGATWGCTGTSGLKSEYANSGNLVGKTGTYALPRPNVYDSTMSSIAPTLSYENGYGRAQNNGYTIAYYVEEYLNTLGINGTGRLLTHEEEQSLASSNNEMVFNGTSYWLGSAYNSYFVCYVESDGAVRCYYLGIDADYGVRPVIVVNTSDISS